MSRLEREPENSASAILERAITGDTAAFEQILIRHERRVLTLAWRLLGSMEDAQDAAQEVFLRVFKYLHRFDVQKPFEPWLVRMTINVCRDIGEKRQKRRSIFVEADEPYEHVEHRGPAADPYAQLKSKEYARIVHAALAELPEKERAAIVLRDIEGLSTAEVAEVLGSSEATVRSQISTARVKIKKAIERGGRP
ncbi:MAG: RNA polymerase sigma factor [Acidobacteria bacterium]|nr:RNA polymerase sigma factor [Acidobacteriota bacterium]